MRHFNLSALSAILFVAACAGGPGGSGGPTSRAIVEGAGDELLKLRSGPGLGYKIILGLPDGTVLARRGCVTEVGQLWCRVTLNGAPGISGYVSADYLSNR